MPYREDRYTRYASPGRSYSAAGCEFNVSESMVDIK